MEKPGHEPNERRDHINGSSAEQDALNTHSLSMFTELTKNLEINTDPVTEIFEQLTEYREKFLESVSKITLKNISDSESIQPLINQVNADINAYLKLITALPASLLENQYTADEMLFILTEQYHALDKSLVEQLSEEIGRDDVFTVNDYSIVDQTLKSNYSATESDIATFSQITSQSVATSVASDMQKYISFLNSQNDKEKELSQEQMVAAVMDKTQSIIERLDDADKSKQLRARLGKHAVDIAKIVAGSTLGFMIAKRFNQ